VRLLFTTATPYDASEIAALQASVSVHLTTTFGPGQWSTSPSQKAILRDIRRPKFSRTLLARDKNRILATLRLATKKPWAIDTSYFTSVIKPLYLTGMAVRPDLQRQGIGRELMRKAEAEARAWPADAIRLDSYDALAGAGPFYAKCGYRELAQVSYKGNPLIYFELMLEPTKNPHA
jgi:predicted N-acetyltransferase YhbS